MLSSDRPAALAKFLAELRQRRWHVRGVEVVRRGEVFLVHGRRHTPGGVAEAIVADQGAASGLDLYVLPAAGSAWLTCDRTAFDGFLADGSILDGRGVAYPEEVACACGRPIHLSAIRAKRTLRMGSAVRRVARCEEEIRAFHLAPGRHGGQTPWSAERSDEVMFDLAIREERTAHRYVPPPLRELALHLSALGLPTRYVRIVTQTASTRDVVRAWGGPHLWLEASATRWRDEKIKDVRMEATFRTSGAEKRSVAFRSMEDFLAFVTKEVASIRQQ